MMEKWIENSSKGGEDGDVHPRNGMGVVS